MATLVRSGAFDSVEQVVDPFVEIQVDRRAVHQLDRGSFSDQENPAIRSSWAGFSWKVAKSTGSPVLAPEKTKCRARRVLPAPDGPAMSVEAPRQ